MHEATNTREGILKIATITYIILPFGIWASTCIPSSLCAMRLLLTGACGGGGLSSNSARLQWPTNLTSFKKKKRTLEKLKCRWGTDLPCVQKLDLPRICILQMRKQKPIEPRVHTGVNADRGYTCPPVLGSSCFLLCSTAPAAAPTQIYISCLWVLFFLG